MPSLPMPDAAKPCLRLFGGPPKRAGQRDTVPALHRRDRKCTRRSHRGSTHRYPAVQARRDAGRLPARTDAPCVSFRQPVGIARREWILRQDALPNALAIAHKAGNVQRITPQRVLLAPTATRGCGWPFFRGGRPIIIHHNQTRVPGAAALQPVGLCRHTNAAEVEHVYPHR
jgi:hypothetical protein